MLLTDDCDGCPSAKNNTLFKKILYCIRYNYILLKQSIIGIQEYKLFVKKIGYTYGYKLLHT